MSEKPTPRARRAVATEKKSQANSPPFRSKDW
jgi:hypothetical protein